MKGKRFRYLGVTFEDLGVNVSFENALKHVTSDRELGMSKYDWGIFPYTYESFYKATKDSKSDLFKCVRNGRIYIPGNNELFLYE